MKQRIFGQMNFVFPDDGVMLTDAAGEKNDEGILIEVKVDAARGKTLTLNGAPMGIGRCGIYVGKICLRDYKTTLTVRDEESGEEISSDVYYLKRAHKKYRFSLDDNIWFLQNLTLNKDKYQSMFEDPYLGLLKRIHGEYGSVFHINIYYEDPKNGGFNLTEMTDKYKDEWSENSDWLRLSFHANANSPAKPYAHASYEQTYLEAERVNREILRFAGEEAYSRTVTTVHFGDCTVEAARALRDLGYRAFPCSAKKDADGVDIRMYLDSEQCEILREYGFYYDKENDIIHFKFNGGIQHVSPEEIPEKFAAQEAATPKYIFKDICLHEQYFYPDYPRYQPNYYEKMSVSARWCKEHGYEPMFMDEIFEFDTHKK